MRIISHKVVQNCSRGRRPRPPPRIFGAATVQLATTRLRSCERIIHTTKERSAGPPTLPVLHQIGTATGGEGRRPRRPLIISRLLWHFRRGFTLVELLVVILILGLVVAVIGACLAAGIRVWDEAQSFNTVQNEAVFAVNLMEKDLMNSFPFYAIKFTGGSKDFSCPNIVLADEQETWKKSESSPDRGLGTVKYYFEPGGGTIFRETLEYAGERTSVHNAEKIAENVENMNVEYLHGDNMAGGAGWKDTWTDPTNLPPAVRINLSFSDRGTPIRIVRTVLLPRGSGGTQ